MNFFDEWASRICHNKEIDNYIPNKNKTIIFPDRGMIVGVFFFSRYSDYILLTNHHKNNFFKFLK